MFVTLSPVAGEGGKRIAPVDISRRLEAIAAKVGLAGIWPPPLPAPCAAEW